MKFVSLILALNLLTSSLHVCLGKIECIDNMEIQLEQQNMAKSYCCTGKTSEDSPSNENLPCEEGCACCFVMPVVITNADIDVELHPELFQQEKSWVANHYTQDFTHLIWHPPQVIS